MASPRTAFVAWKAERKLTDEQIADEVRKRGLACSRQMISMLLSGDRKAGLELAEVLGEITGLSFRYFMVQPEAAPAASAPASEPDAAA